MSKSKNQMLAVNSNNSLSSIPLTNSDSNECAICNSDINEKLLSLIENISSLPNDNAIASQLKKTSLELVSNVERCKLSISVDDYFHVIHYFYQLYLIPSYYREKTCQSLFDPNPQRQEAICNIMQQLSQAMNDVLEKGADPLKVISKLYDSINQQKSAVINSHECLGSNQFLRSAKSLMHRAFNMRSRLAMIINHAQQAYLAGPKLDPVSPNQEQGFRYLH